MSKRLLAIVLTLCLLLTTVPAFAATYSYYKPAVIPAEGMDVTITGTGADSTVAMKLVLHKDSASALGLDPATVTSTAMDGAVLSGDFVYNNPRTYVVFTDGGWATTSTDASKVTEKFVIEQFEPVEGDAVLYNQPIPVEGTYYDEEGNVIETCTIEKKQVASDSHPVKIPIIKAVANNSKTAVCINVNFADLVAASNNPELPLGQEKGSGAWTLSNIKLYPTEASVDSGVFPEGTVFISSSAVINNPGDWVKSTDDGYSFYRKGSSTSYGPYALLTPKATDTYDVYCLMKESNDGTGRTVALNIGNSGEYAFKKGNADAVHSWYWEKAQNGKTVTLTEGESVLVQGTTAFAGYGRWAALALVPTSEEFDSFSDAESAHTHVFARSDIEFLQNETITVEDVEMGDPVSVTVDGVSYSVAPGTAANAGIAIPTMHKHGEFIKDALVWDAIVAAGITKITDRAIYVNGNVCYSPEYTYLKEGDVITTTEEVNVTNFSRVKLVDIHNTDGSATLGGIKMCLTYSNVGSVLGSWAQVSEALLGAYFSGYFETLDQAITGLGVTAAGDKIYFENLLVETQQAYSTSRIDLQLDNRTNPNTAANVVKTLPDGVTKVHAPYAFVNQKKNSWYSYDNVYLVNSTTPIGVTAVKLADGKYALDTEGDKLIYIVTATYSEDGKTLVSTNVKEEYITYNRSAIVNVADNQKVMVWGRRAYNNQPTLDGTTMVPLCAPLTK